MFYTATKERIILGKSKKDICMRAPVIGRLICYKSIKSFVGNEAILAVVRELPDEADSYLFDDGRVVGTVFVSDMTDAPSELPFPSICIRELSADFNERIALLDHEGDRLFISPDISTVNRYLPRLFCGQGESLPSFVLREGRRLSLSAITEADAKGFGGRLILPLPDISDPDELYLRLAETVEGTWGRQVTFCISEDQVSPSSIGAVMRSALWGEVSLLLCNQLTEDGVTDAMRSFCRAFCELEGDRREFNGYISRGLRIDSPYLLSIAEGLYGIDLFLFDIETLAALFCNRDGDIPYEVIAHILCRISEITGKRREVSYGVILGRRTVTGEICNALFELGVESYAAASELMPSLYRALQ